ncbi:MAG: hypothetical protein FWH47_01295 [Methanomassiliicoccaceae archaeon]|nr:hypothetical protein [Methanomassiliicoccaceae archaeon]
MEVAVRNKSYSGIQGGASFELENEILLKYKGGAHLDINDNKYLVYKLKSIGFLRCGFDLEKNEETVRTTARGIGLLEIRGII